MKLRNILLILLLLCAVPIMAVAQDDQTLINEKYVGQRTFSCNGHEFKIPSHFPYTYQWHDDNYLTAAKSSCTLNNFSVTLGRHGPDCLGGAVCRSASFSSVKRLGSRLDDLFGKILLVYAKEVKLSRNRDGYFVPSVCGANCDEAQLVWSDGTGVYIIGGGSNNSQEAIDELIESANSYIGMEK